MTDRRWILGYSALLAVVTSIPYLIGFQAQGTEWVFTGFVFGVEDGNSYIAKMLQGQSGAWLFTTPYSSSGGPGILAFLPYLVLGKLAAGDELHLQLVLLFHAVRLACVPLAVAAVHGFVSHFVAEPRLRRWATVVATAGGGLGWLLALLGQANLLGSLPLDFYSPESFGFLAFYGLPHLLLAKALLLLGLTSFLRSPQVRNGRIAGGLFLLVGLVQPLTVIAGYAAVGASLLASRLRGPGDDPGSGASRLARSAAWAIGIPLPVVGYYALGAWLDPALRQWTGQNVLPSPHPVHYLIGYSLLIVPAGAAALKAVRQGGRGRILLIWAGLLLALAYFPIPVQRRLIDGAWLALAILAALGLRRASMTAQRALGAASLATSVFLILGGAWSAGRPSTPLFRPVGEVAAFEAVARQASPGSVVLASFETGNALPAWAPVRSVVGHGPETANLAALLPRVNAFFGPAMPARERARLLSDEGVDFVFYGPSEGNPGGWGQTAPSGLTEVVREGAYIVFAVARP